MADFIELVTRSLLTGEECKIFVRTSDIVMLKSDDDEEGIDEEFKGFNCWIFVRGIDKPILVKDDYENIKGKISLTAALEVAAEEDAKLETEIEYSKLTGEL